MGGKGQPEQAPDPSAIRTNPEKIAAGEEDMPWALQALGEKLQKKVG